MPNVRPLNRKKYNISKRAFQTAYNYCLQYTEWKEELAVKRDTRAGQNLTGQPGSHNCSDSTADAAMELSLCLRDVQALNFYILLRRIQFPGVLPPAEHSGNRQSQFLLCNISSLLLEYNQ